MDGEGWGRWAMDDGRGREKKREAAQRSATVVKLEVRQQQRHGPRSTDSDQLTLRTGFLQKLTQ